MVEAPGEPVPTRLDGADGLVVLGGVMDADETGDYPHLLATMDLLRDAADRGAPALGICLGAQMLTVNLGAKVGFHPQELVEIGYYPLLTTEAAEALAATSDPLDRVDRLWEARAASVLGLALVELGEFGAADEALARSGRLFEALGQAVDAAGAVHNRGWCAARRGDVPAALRRLQTGLVRTWPTSTCFPPSAFAPPACTPGSRPSRSPTSP